MDINLVREAVLVLGLGAFIGIACWAYGPWTKGRFERAASAVFQDDEQDARSMAEVLARARREGEGD